MQILKIPEILHRLTQKFGLGVGGGAQNHYLKNEPGNLYVSDPTITLTTTDSPVWSHKISNKLISLIFLLWFPPDSSAV